MKNTTKEINCRVLKDNTIVMCSVKGTENKIPQEIFMVKVKDSTALTSEDVKYLGREDHEGYWYTEDEYHLHNGVPCASPGRGFFDQSRWNNKRFLTKKAAEKHMHKEVSAIMWNDIREELLSNLMVVKTKVQWEEA